MAKIRKIYDETIKPNGEKTVIYPITSTRAVYTPTSVTIDSLLNEGYRFGGIVLPTDSPSITDQRVFYGASVPGNYANFGGINVDGGEAIFFMWDGTTWHKGIFGGAGSNNLTGFKSLASITDLPNEPTMYGYLIDDYMYVWVGENGDTLSGTYQNVGQLRGASAYEVAVRNGYEGTEQQWLADPVNGIKGVSVTSITEIGTHSDANSAENTYRITLSNNEKLDMKVKNGKGINSVAIVGNYSALEGATNTYRITLSDNTVFEFQVINGSQGNTGSSIDYPFELLNVLNSTATDKGVTALKVKELNESATHIGTTLNSTDTNIKYINDFEGTPVNPVTHERGVLDDNGNSIEPKLQHAQDLDDALVTATTYDREALLDFTKRNYIIDGTSGNWGTSTSSKHIRITVKPGDDVYVTANSDSGAGVAFFNANTDSASGETPPYADGWSNRVAVPAGKTMRFIAPSDATRLYLSIGTMLSYVYTPYSVAIRRVDGVALQAKADKDTDAGEGNLAMFDATGNPVDSGIGQGAIGQVNQRVDTLEESLTEIQTTPFKVSYALLADSFGTGTSLYHGALPVHEGERYRIANHQGVTDPNTASYTRYAFATTIEATSGGTVPVVSGTSIVELMCGESVDIVVPAGCTYLLVNYKVNDQGYPWDVARLITPTKDIVVLDGQKLDIKPSLRNILDPSTILEGVRINKTNGNEVVTSGCYCTPFIPVHKSGLVVVKGDIHGNNIGHAVYDSSKSYLRQIASSVYTYQEGDGYVRFSLTTPVGAMVCVGTGEVPYEDYDGMRGYVENLVPVNPGKNLLDPDKVIGYKYVSGANGQLVTTTYYTGVTDYIPCDSRGLFCNKLIFTGTNGGWAAFDKDFKYTHGAGGSSATFTQYEYQEGDAYVRFSISRLTGAMVNVGNTEEEYEPYTPIGGYLTEDISMIHTSTGSVGNCVIRAAKEHTFIDGTPPILEWFLLEEPVGKFYLSKDLVTKEHLFNFSGTSRYFRFGILGNGDIIAVRTADSFDESQPQSDSRRTNPYVWKANENWMVQHTVDFGEALKPVAWLSSKGYRVMPNGDVIFGEYTRPTVETCNVWKISGDPLDAGNWTVLKSFYPIGGDGDDMYKHVHCIALDHYTGIVYCTTGDTDAYSQIWYSSDYGETWTQLSKNSSLNNGQQFRLCMMTFTPDKIIWATDTPGLRKHVVYIGERDTNGVLDTTTLSLLCDLTPQEGNYSSYGQAYLPEYNAVFLFDRQDGGGTQANHIPIYVIDLNTGNKHLVADLAKVPGGGNFGFRTYFKEWYPVNGVIRVGFGFDTTYANYLKVCGNGLFSTGTDRGMTTVNNLIIVVRKDGDRWTCRFTTSYA